jgi:hypothetical protein
MLSQTGETKWVYTDDQGAQQGPFTTAEVNGWFTAGYLQGDRLIKKDGEDGEFVPLSSVPELCAPAAAPPAAAQPQAGYVDPNAYGMQPQMMMPQQMAPQMQQWNQSPGLTTENLLQQTQ